MLFLKIISLARRNLKSGTLPVVIVAVSVNVVCGHLIRMPENAAVTEGATVVFKCQTNNTTQNIIWRASTNPTDDVKLYTNNRIAEHLSDVYKVNHSVPGQFDLHIKASLSTAKIYLCMEGAFGPSNGSAELIVFESKPKCETIGSGTKFETNRYRSLEAKCTIRYSGNRAPEMSWTIIEENEGQQQVHDLEENNTYTDSLLLSSIVLNAQPIFNNSRLEFKATFSKNRNLINHNLVSTTAKNIPEYAFVWQSPILVVNADSNGFLFFFGNSVSGPDTVVVTVIVISTAIVIIGIVFFFIWRLKAYSNSKTIVDEQNETSDDNAPPRRADLLIKDEDVERERKKSSKPTEKKSVHSYLEMHGFTTKPHRIRRSDSSNSSIDYVDVDPAVGQSTWPPSPPDKPPRTRKYSYENQNPESHRTMDTRTTPDRRSSKVDENSTVLYAEPINFDEGASTLTFATSTGLNESIFEYASIDHSSETSSSAHAERNSS